MEDIESQDIVLETPAPGVFIAPSIDREAIRHGASYTYRSAIPAKITQDISAECVLGVDEAGRGPVLGPMVYGLLYLPVDIHQTLLADKYHFDDSKVLTPQVRSDLLRALCTPESDLFEACGWSTRVMSARDISAGMLKSAGTYNLNAQAMDATITLIQEVFDQGINVTEIYIDTIGSPAVYQKKLERIFPSTKITVAKKADSLYPCVSAASVCAKVTRDAALEAAYENCIQASLTDTTGSSSEGWGSGYPSDARCTAWMKEDMDPLFGWGNECRFSWSTAKDMLDNKAHAFTVEWPVSEDDETTRVTDYFLADNADAEDSELALWYGRPVAEVAL